MERYYAVNLKKNDNIGVDYGIDYTGVITYISILNSPYLTIRDHQVVSFRHDSQTSQIFRS